MGTKIKLTATDGHKFDAYVAESTSPARGAIVLIQEIFGVNSHIRSVADDYAGQGFYVIAPALFDRVQPNLELGYNPADTAQGMKAARQIGMDAALLDVAASIAHARAQWPELKVGVLGFCYGGSLAWLAATRLDPAAAVCYYGGQIAANANETPRCPVMMHFGAKDPHIGSAEIEKIKAAHPDLPLFLYDAGHGFNCDQRKDYEPESANLARQRTLEFFNRHL
ncbi:MAG TPA: dienelactone hydrolase family protein [Candidatus Angelobacter sp.]|jgi:carboxymethylenebutenolidase|nr:dienelactone hydrolase family protein [Candidatus Angelobacter sp.]